MAELFRVKFDGVQKHRLKVKLLSSTFRAGLKKELERQGTIIERKAKDLITDKGHIVTGNLRRSIQTQAEIRGLNDIEVNIGTNVEYAPQIEALPDGGFLFPAFVERRDAAVKGIERLFRLIKDKI